jgi:hypothetical protein
MVCIQLKVVTAFGELQKFVLSITFAIILSNEVSKPSTNHSRKALPPKFEKIINDLNIKLLNYEKITISIFDTYYYEYDFLSRSN